MLRELEPQELAFVAGGEDDVIIVNGTPSRYAIDYSIYLNSFGQFGDDIFALPSGGGGGGGGTTSPYAPDEDIDGDGIPNWEEQPIVVTALTPEQQEAANRFADDAINLLQGALAIGTGVLFIEVGALEGAIASIFGNARIGQAVLNVATLTGTTIAVSELRQMFYEAAAIELANGTFIQEPVPGDWDYAGPGWDIP